MQITEEKTNKNCLKYLKQLIKDVEDGKKIITSLSEDMELVPCDVFIYGPVSSPEYTGKDWISIEVKRKGVFKNESI